MLQRVTLALGLIIVCSPVVAAQDAPDVARDEEARSLFQAGSLAFSDGRYEEALTHFERAYELSKRPALLFNIGTVADRLRQNRRALEAFEQYLAEVPEPPQKKEVMARIRVLRRAVENAAEEPATSSTVPTPAAAAASEAAQGDEPNALEPDPGAAEGGGVHTKWWFWTLIGAAVAGAVVAVVVVTAEDDPFIQGANGVTFTLGAARP